MRPNEKCMNSVTLLGRVSNDLQLRGSEDRPVLAFNLVTSENYKVNEEWTSRAYFHNIVSFKYRFNRNLYENVGKGDRLLVTGKLTYSMNEDRETGFKRQNVAIFADEIIRLAKKGQRLNQENME